MCMGKEVDGNTLRKLPGRKILKLFDYDWPDKHDDGYGKDALGKVGGLNFSKYDKAGGYCFLIHPIRINAKLCSTGDHLHCICDDEKKRDKLYKAFMRRFSSLGIACKGADDSLLGWAKRLDAASVL
jgi:hypothetical protein